MYRGVGSIPARPPMNKAVLKDTLDIILMFAGVGLLLWDTITMRFSWIGLIGATITWLAADNIKSELEDQQ
jgi:hypothetical protein